MLTTKTLEEIISQYYDEQMGKSALLNYEARIAISKGLREYTNNICFEYYKISNSMKKVKTRSSKRAQEIVEKINLDKKENLFNVYSVFLKSIYKQLRSLFLDFLRNNSK